MQVVAKLAGPSSEHPDWSTRCPQPGRTFRAGKIGDPKKLAEGASMPEARNKINYEALQANALSTAWQMLTAPTEQDRVRRGNGPQVEDLDPTVAPSFGLGEG